MGEVKRTQRMVWEKGDSPFPIPREKKGGFFPGEKKPGPKGVPGNNPIPPEKVKTPGDPLWKEGDPPQEDPQIRGQMGGPVSVLKKV